jgi:hypothetical protein
MTSLYQEIEVKAKASGFSTFWRAVLLGNAMAQTGLSVFKLFLARSPTTRRPP